MHFINNLSVALVAALAASAQADRHVLRQRPFHRRGNPSSGLPTIYSTVTPSSSAVPSSIVASSPVSSPVSVPLGTGAAGSAPQSGSAFTSDLVVTYTLGTGTSTSVVTTTIHRTATNEHTVYAVCI